MTAFGRSSVIPKRRNWAQSSHSTSPQTPGGLGPKGPKRVRAAARSPTDQPTPTPRPASQPDGEDEPAADARGIGFDPDFAVMAFNDLFADRQPDAGTAAVIVLVMQPLEDLEHPLGLIGRDTDAVIVQSDAQPVLDRLDPQFDLRRAGGVGIFDGVGDQVLEDTGHLARGAGHRGHGWRQGDGRL